MILQMVSLYRNGELVKMSKRTGQSVTLNELIEEVGTDAARFFFAMRSIDSQLDFDLTLATEKSNENPVYYIQYAHARICSIMRQLAEENVVEAAAADYNLLTDATELELIKKLGEYQEMLELAAKERAVQPCGALCARSGRTCSIPSIISAVSWCGPGSAAGTDQAGTGDPPYY